MKAADQSQKAPGLMMAVAGPARLRFYSLGGFYLSDCDQCCFEYVYDVIADHLNDNQGSGYCLLTLSISAGR